MGGRLLAVGARVALGGGAIQRPGEMPCERGRERLEEGDDRWGPLVGERRGGGRTISGLRVSRPGLNSELGRFGSPRPLLYFFLFLFFFFILISVLFSIFCKNASNHFKSTSKIF
jgi:hypothetical protein